MSTSIIYTSDNVEEVKEFIGEQPPCPTCGGHGEYEGEYGPVGCQPCNSRCIAFIDNIGKRVFADWGDTIKKTEDRLELIMQAPPTKDTF